MLLLILVALPFLDVNISVVVVYSGIVIVIDVIVMAVIACILNATDVMGDVDIAIIIVGSVVNDRIVIISTVSSVRVIVAFIL